MRYEKLEALLRIALTMRGSAEGISLDDIRRDHGVSRRTAERMRDVIERVFPQIEQANPGEVPKRWRIRADIIANLVGFSVDELAAMKVASDVLRRDNLAEFASRLDGLSIKLNALIKPEETLHLAPDLESLAEAEGTALRPRPRQRIAPGIFADLRYAIIACRQVILHYRARGTGRLSRQRVCPYGFLYGNRHYLVAFSTNERTRDYRLFVLANIEKAETTDRAFARRKDFSLLHFAERSFGAFQEEPFDVVWRFSPEAAVDAREFLFHPTQTMETEPDGSLVVKFRAGGALEMCWHLFTWGSEVEIVEPKRLQSMLHELAGALLKKRRPPP